LRMLRKPRGTGMRPLEVGAVLWLGAYREIAVDEAGNAPERADRTELRCPASRADELVLVRDPLLVHHDANLAYERRRARTVEGRHAGDDTPGIKAGETHRSAGGGGDGLTRAPR